jgi:hypothetical protein
MKAKQTIAASAAVVTAVSYWIAHNLKRTVHRQQQFERKCLQNELDRFEGEGGLVLN